MSQPNVTEINVERTVAKLIVAKFNAYDDICEIDKATVSDAIALLKLQATVDANPLGLTPVESRIYRTLRWPLSTMSITPPSWPRQS